MSSKEIMPVSIKETELISPVAGLSRQVLAYNEKLMLVRNLMEKGWIGLRHSHPHEQRIASAAANRAIALLFPVHRHLLQS
jgi:hypothetical protein